MVIGPRVLAFSCEAASLDEPRERAIGNCAVARERVWRVRDRAKHVRWLGTWGRCVGHCNRLGSNVQLLLGSPAVGHGDHGLRARCSAASVAAQLQARYHPNPYIANSLHSASRDAQRVVLSRQTTEGDSGSYSHFCTKIAGSFGGGERKSAALTRRLAQEKVTGQWTHEQANGGAAQAR